MTKHCAWHLKWTRLSLSCHVFVETQVFTVVQAVDILLWSFDKKLSPYCFLTMWSTWRNTNGTTGWFCLSVSAFCPASCATERLKLKHHNRRDSDFIFGLVMVLLHFDMGLSSGNLISLWKYTQNNLESQILREIPVKVLMKRQYCYLNSRPMIGKGRKDV